MASIQQLIDQTKDSIRYVEQEEIESESFDSRQFDNATNEQKINSLKNEQLKYCSESKVQLNSELDENTLKIDTLKNEEKEMKIKAPSSGIVHIVHEGFQNKLINSGELLAQIYPIINDNQKIKLKAYVDTENISSVKKGQILRMKITRNVPTPIILEGKISSISVAPVLIDKKSYYVLEAYTKIEKGLTNKIHYGMSGQGSIITDRVSFFNYYKNRFLI